MNFVRGKRRIPQERMYGFLKVNEPRAGVKAFYIVIGQRAWGWRWATRKS